MRSDRLSPRLHRSAGHVYDPSLQIVSQLIELGSGLAPLVSLKLKIAAFYFRHEILASRIEVHDFHYRADGRFGVEVGVARGAESPAHQGRIAAGAERFQCALIRLQVVQEKSKMMEALAPAFQMFLVAGLAGEMLDEFD